MLNQPNSYLIYGANSSIGAELARNVAGNVEHLVLFYHKKTDKIKDLFSYSNVHAVQSDIRDFEDLSKKLKDVYTKWNITDLAAVYLPAIRSYDHKPLDETSLELSKNIIEVNFLGAVHFLKGIMGLRKLKSSTDTLSPSSIRFVLLGSNVSRIGLKNGAIYAASKAALGNLSRSVAIEMGRRNILINTVSPGPVETDDLNISEDYTLFRKEYFETHKALSSLNKVGSVFEICSLILFLTSLENTHITGEEIFITGGAL